ncbi:hypothetical protein chiPu_0028999, partial [Chiloscyllium punctatum]|nr:hypothetical protein [Chiloscyllium punctatum]
MDLVSVTTASGLRHFSFLSVAWGFVADVDIESERFRAAGSARFTVGTLLCLASLRRYRGRLSYLPAPPSPSSSSVRAKPALRRSATNTVGDPAPVHPPLGRALSEDGLWARPPLPRPESPGLPGEGFSFEAASLGEDEGEWGGSWAALPDGGGTSRETEGDAPAPGPSSSPRPPPSDHLLPPLDQPVPGHWETLEGEFVLVLAISQSHLGADLVAVPLARFSEGRLHLCYVRAGISRPALLRLFLAMGRGAHFGLACPYLHCVPALAFRLVPLGSPGIVTIDGERVEAGPLQAQ